MNLKKSNYIVHFMFCYAVLLLLAYISPSRIVRLCERVIGSLTHNLGT